MTIYIGNLSFQATEDDLKDVFAEYGTVTRISLPIDRESGRKRGFAFVEMEDESKEDQVISELDGAEWLGRELRVNKAKPRDNSSSNRSDRANNFSRNPL
ncbi:MAG: RNA-binding protein [Cyanobacteria bacterium P01_H01_bin.119]